MLSTNIKKQIGIILTIVVAYIGIIYIVVSELETEQEYNDARIMKCIEKEYQKYQKE